MCEQAAVLGALLPNDLLLRVLLRRSELDDPRSAFFLRANEKDSGLSVNFDYTPDECRAQPCFDKTYGVRSLTVQSVQALALGVQPDEPHHANITGLPHVDDDPDRAEYLAGQLERVSTLVSAGLIKNNH
jgi:hypothetical protein